METKIIRIPETGYSSNCYLLFSDKTKKGVIIDPSSDIRVLKDLVEEHGISIEKLILTHAHADHIYSIEEAKEEFNAPVMVHEGDFDMLKDGEANFSKAMYREAIELEADEIMKDGDLIKVSDDLELEVIHTPGHTPGGVCLKVEDVIITGDTIFAASIGRTDFPGGNYEQLMDSIKNKLLIYPDETILLPGHGGESNIGAEKRINPFLR